MTIDLTPIFQAVIALLAAIITYKLVPWIKTKTTEGQRVNLSAIIKVLVFAAEQIYDAGQGEQKLNYVLGKLRERGYDVDADMIRESIEAAVYNIDTNPALLLEGDVAPLEDWPLEMIQRFCELNGIPHGGCVTKEDYIWAIKGGNTYEPPNGGEEAEG